jgi:hypothetical protein
MDLLPQSIRNQLPELYAQDGKGKDAIAYVKYFTPAGSWTWYGTEFDSASETFFGYVKGLENELGYFTLKQIQDAKDQLGVAVERDLSFEPTALNQLGAY